MEDQMQQLGESWVEITLQLYNVCKLGESPSNNKCLKIKFSFLSPLNRFFFDTKEHLKLQKLKLTLKCLLVMTCCTQSFVQIFGPCILIILSLKKCNTNTGIFILGICFNSSAIEMTGQPANYAWKVINTCCLLRGKFLSKIFLEPWIFHQGSHELFNHQFYFC